MLPTITSEKEKIQRYSAIIKGDVLKAARLMYEAWADSYPEIGDVITTTVYDMNNGDDEPLRQIVEQPIDGSDGVDLAQKGGIDFNPDKIDLKTQNNSGEIIFNTDPAMLQRVQNAPGMTPVIIGINSLNSLSAFMGVHEPME